MNFVDAAVALLREAREPMHVEELCRLALERGLLDSPGQTPLRSLKGRLTTELKRGPESRVVRVEDDLWALAGPDGEEGETAAEPADEGSDRDADESEATVAPVEAAGETTIAAPFGSEDEDDDDAEEDEEEGFEDEDDEEEEGFEDEDPDEGFEDEVDDESEEEEDDDEGFPEEGEEEIEDERSDLEVQAEEKAAGEAAAAARDLQAREAETLSPEEKELVQVYREDAGTAQMGARVEYRDQQTADEDRPMMPELLPERRGRGREDWKARRERMRDKRRERREERDRNKAARDKNAAPAARPAEGEGQEAESARPAAERPAEAEAAAPARRELPAGEADLARRASEVLASIKGAQPVPVRQLAQMMRKRRLVQAEPEVMWRPLKSALLADHQRRAAAGLPPRVAYRGRDLFSYRPSANAELEAAEDTLESAAHRLRGATERTLAARLVELPLPVLEQVAQLYLVQTGWRELEWIKRVDRSGYAIARERGEGPPVMIAVRSGNQEVDRRGVGELRAGVAAKNLARGFLLAPRELGGDARAELERPGKPVGALCGLPWASALIDAGIGVVLRAMPVAYLDAELLDRLGEG